MLFGRLVLIVIATLISAEALADECRDAVEASNAFLTDAVKRSTRNLEGAVFGSAQVQCDELRRWVTDLEQELRNTRTAQQVCGARYRPSKCDEACESAELARQRKEADAVCERARQWKVLCRRNRPSSRRRRMRRRGTKAA
jgi:hypothetical protein